VDWEVWTRLGTLKRPWADADSEGPTEARMDLLELTWPHLVSPKPNSTSPTVQ
jgi:hypothetical protein